MGRWIVISIVALAPAWLAACRQPEELSQLVIHEGGRLPRSEPSPAETHPVELEAAPGQASSDGAATSEASAADPDTTGEAVAADEDGAVSGETVGAPSTDAAEIAPLPSTTGLGRAGGELEAGGYQVTIPGLEEPTEVTFRRLDPSELRQPRPPSVILASAELEPAYTSARGMMALDFSLDDRIEVGATVQLLSYSRSMDAFAVVDESRVPDDRVVTLHTDMFSQYAVTAAPELRETACLGGPFALDQRVPDRPESEVVGQVEVEDRMPREVALAVLTDMRYLPGSELIVFKNEERRAGQGDAPGPHANEDFLVDPRLAQPLVRLARGVHDQWRDPVGGGPAFALRVTDAYDSQIEHSPTSNHYRGLAVDLTLSPVPAASRSARQTTYGWLARQAACAGFDFSHFENRFHVHASSRSARVAFIEERDDGRFLTVTRVDGSQRIDVSSECGLALHDRDIRTLTFDDDGYVLELTGRRKGIAEAFRIDLRSLEVDVLTPPARPEPPSSSVAVDASLVLDRSGDRLLLRRPDIEPSTLPFALTDEGVRAATPTIWLSQAVPGDSPAPGDLTP